MRRTLTLTLLLFLWPCLAWAQPPQPNGSTTTIVGANLTAEELKALEERYKKDGEQIAAVQGKIKEVTISVGGYHRINTDGTVKLPLTFWSLTAGIVAKVNPPVNAPYTAYLRENDAAEPNVIEFPAAANPYWLLVGKKVGRTTVLILENGEPTKAGPKVMVQLNITVGSPAPPGPVDPPTPPPSNDALVLAARADVATGKGTAADVGWYRELFLHAAADATSNAAMQTNRDLFDVMNIAIDKRLEDAKSPTAKLPSMRRVVAEDLKAMLGPFNVVNLDTASRRLHADAFTRIADRLKGY